MVTDSHAPPESGLLTEEGDVTPRCAEFGALDSSTESPELDPSLRLDALECSDIGEGCPWSHRIVRVKDELGLGDL